MPCHFIEPRAEQALDDQQAERLPSTDDVGDLNDEVQLHDRQHDEQQPEHQQHQPRLPVAGASSPGRIPGWRGSAPFGRARSLSRARRTSQAAPTSAIHAMARGDRFGGDPVALLAAVALGGHEAGVGQGLKMLHHRLPARPVDRRRARWPWWTVRGVGDGVQHGPARRIGQRGEHRCRVALAAWARAGGPGHVSGRAASRRAARRSVERPSAPRRPSHEAATSTHEQARMSHRDAAARHHGLGDGELDPACRSPSHPRRTPRSTPRPARSRPTR